MRKLAYVAAALAACGAIGAGTPAEAAVGQCYDAYGRPVGPPHDTKNPPYGLICQVYRAGGSCTHVQPHWAASNCGYDYGPRYRYRHDYYRRDYDDDGYRYRRYNYDRGTQYRTYRQTPKRPGETEQERAARDYNRTLPPGFKPDFTHPRPDF